MIYEYLTAIPFFLYRSALHYAAANGHQQVVVALVGAGSKVNIQDINGCSPLHYAAASMLGDGR